MAPKVKAKIEDSEKLLERAIRKSQTGRFFNWLELLWPNVRNILLRLTESLCAKVENKDNQFKILAACLHISKKRVTDARPELLGHVGKDRLILVLFLQGVVEACADKIYSVQSVGGKSTSGAKPTRPTPELAKKTLDRLLCERDRDILGQDIEDVFNFTPVADRYRLDKAII
ncbi:hypothetical protein GSUB_16580 (plasmid) [Geoalkalibacter subterraneus]|uniref:Uncharacterized protein n=2 Tax=Geoalkalibacter subterraneus TaxID=483547 RepID=A0A0B5FVB6_9BACT|nr:hypothetical protein GSUB_16580 [Geoalkalibacter subterraneus]